MYKQIVLSNKRSTEDFKDFHKRVYQEEINDINKVKNNKFEEYLLIYKAFSIFVISNKDVARHLFLTYKKCKSKLYVLYSLQNFLENKFQDGLKDRKGIVTSITRYRMKTLTFREIIDFYNHTMRPKDLIKYLIFRIINI